MTVVAVEAWVEAPLRRFVEDARTVLALLLHPSGQVVAQFGFVTMRPFQPVAAACASSSFRWSAFTSGIKSGTVGSIR